MHEKKDNNISNKSKKKGGEIIEKKYIYEVF